MGRETWGRWPARCRGGHQQHDAVWVTSAALGARAERAEALVASVPAPLWHARTHAHTPHTHTHARTHARRHVDTQANACTARRAVSCAVCKCALSGTITHGDRERPHRRRCNSHSDVWSFLPPVGTSLPSPSWRRRSLPFLIGKPDVPFVLTSTGINVQRATYVQAE